jgi:hypothetical protein
MNSNIPIPPGAEGENLKPVDAGVIDAPKVEIEQAKPSLLGRFSSAVARTVKGAFHLAGSALGFVVGKAMWVWDHTGAKLLSLIERWVPGAGRLRSAAFWYTLGMLITGLVLGGLIFAQAGYSLPMVLIGMLYVGLVLVPFIILTTPAMWIKMLIDLWVISCIFTVIDTFCAWLEGRSKHGFWMTLVHNMIPGLYEAVAERKPRLAAAPACA